MVNSICHKTKRYVVVIFYSSYKINYITNKDVKDSQDPDQLYKDSDKHQSRSRSTVKRIIKLRSEQILTLSTNKLKTNRNNQLKSLNLPIFLSFSRVFLVTETLENTNEI